MGKLIFIIFIGLTFCSCANDDAGFDSNSKKKIVESWAWKIFIFTDEGEFTPVETAKNKIDNTTKVSPIFVEDVLEIYSNEDLFLNNQKESFNDPIAFTNFNLTKRKN
ncbi:hypothetical protein DOS84_13330 [Flavobacterium aquariorum]|uniref:Uncharacterized protein n=1 Tax=Flavobacterium aquariorum TaxID=2217670 RepID=A0A2W7U6H4_9FLAO|nr:hypothetical protein [Flavobacterium aquariorum]PZX92849.1 hypothetical protein DOS84_13330 [Flavobacterium aquariorum]